MADFNSSLNMEIFAEDMTETSNNYTAEAAGDCSMSHLETVFTALILAIIILATIIGNVLVIISVFTYRPLQNVQNMFLVSLAVADITVAVLVMPLNVAYTLMSRWKFGLTICKIWLTCDVLCCTASILHLSAIALDRYWAIHDPINYASKRTLSRVLTMIIIVWVVSMTISVPPLIGWNDWPEDFTEKTPCILTEERSYVIYSACGSFYIPLVIMSVVYLKIFVAAKDRLRRKSEAAAKLASVRKRPDTSSNISLNEISPEISNNAATDESASSSANKESDEEIYVIHQDKRVATPEIRIKNPGTGERLKPKNKSVIPKGIPSLTATVKIYIKEKQKICLRKEKRAARILGIVMGGFVVCWLPFFLVYVILPFCEQCYKSKRLVNIIAWFGYFNSALNPVIYTVFNTDFRKAFIYILCRKS